MSSIKSVRPGVPMPQVRTADPNVTQLNDAVVPVIKNMDRQIAGLEDNFATLGEYATDFLSGSLIGPLSGSVSDFKIDFQLTSQSLQAVSGSLYALKQMPFLRGILLGPMSMSAGLNIVAHGLGRQPVGYTMFDIYGAGPVWRQGWDTANIGFYCSSSVVITPWVF